MVSREITTPSIGAVWQREILVQLTSSLIGLESVASNLQQVTTNLLAWLNANHSYGG